MIEIINRRGNKSQDGYIFSFLNGIEPSDRNERKIINEIRLRLDPINTSLKQIAYELGLDPELSTSYTWNSYITHLTSELIVNPIVVRKMVVHCTKKGCHCQLCEVNSQEAERDQHETAESGEKIYDDQFRQSDLELNRLSVFAFKNC